MTTVIEQSCPLCEGIAKYEFMNFYIWKHFKCGTCKEFVISVDVERKLPNHIPQWRMALSDKAKQSDEENIFVITLASTALRQKGMAYPIFNENFMEKKGLVL